MNSIEFSRLNERAIRLATTIINASEHVERAYEALEVGAEFDAEYLRDQLQAASNCLTDVETSFGRLWSRVESAKTE